MKNKRKIRLMQLTTGFSIGGAERKLLELIKFLDPNIFDTTICSVGISGPLKKDFEDTGYDVFLFEKAHKYDFTQVLKVAKLMRDRKIDIVMNTLFYSDIIGTLAAKLAGVPQVVSWEVSSHPVGSEESQWKHILAYRFCMKFNNKIISVSDGVKVFLQEHRNVNASRIQTIRYGIDLDKYIPSDGKAKRKELGLSDSDKVIGVVARFTNQKGHTYLIDAAPQILEAYPETKFVFVGDGPLKDELEAKIQMLGIAGSFRLLGFRQDVVDIVNTFDIFMLPSLYEGLPNVILEAMACGRAIIATAVDGTPEAILHRECGLLVESCKPQPLVDSVLELFGNKKLADTLAANARKRVETQFANDVQFMKIQRLYEEQVASISL